MIVIAERKPLKMMIGPHSQVVGDPLTYALGVVISDVGSDAPEAAIATTARAAAIAIVILPSPGKMVVSNWLSHSGSLWNQRRCRG